MTIVHLILRHAHISMGFVGLVSGAAAMTFRKGSPLHRTSGNVFFVSMLIVGGAGAILAAFFEPNMGNLLGGMMAVLLAAGSFTFILFPRLWAMAFPGYMMPLGVFEVTTGFWLLLKGLSPSQVGET